jgi:hypothetical protein
MVFKTSKTSEIHFLKKLRNVKKKGYENGLTIFYSICLKSNLVPLKLQIVSLNRLVQQ